MDRRLKLIERELEIDPENFVLWEEYMRLRKRLKLIEKDYHKIDAENDLVSLISYVEARIYKPSGSWNEKMKFALMDIVDMNNPYGNRYVNNLWKKYSATIDTPNEDWGKIILLSNAHDALNKIVYRDTPIGNLGLPGKAQNFFDKQGAETMIEALDIISSGIAPKSVEKIFNSYFKDCEYIDESEFDEEF